MKNAIVTIQIDSNKINTDYSKCLETINKYADNINCDFICKHSRDNINYSPHIEKIYLINQMLNVYDRILYLDSDIIIKKNSPNVFDIYNDFNKMYMFNEVEIGKRDCTFAMQSIVQQKPNISINWDNFKYYNAGFILCSKKHQNFFNIDNEYFHVLGRFEQDYINYKIIKNNIDIGLIDIRFNTMIGYDINNLILQEQAYFIHVTPMNKDKIYPLYNKFFL